ncbi:cysteine desulfurase [Candidatus Poribacteria bacterium]|nr:cysteine desulfurase [Candidatus Poribacteria bacterium]
MNVIYLDYNATTPIRVEVLEEMLPCFREDFGNPSSAHAYGRNPGQAVTLARERLSALLGCRPDEIVFTGCGSESDNLAIKGIAGALVNRGNHIITSSVEHPAVTLACKFLESKGFEVTYLSVDEFGRVSPDEVRDAITERTILISVMHANNETGSIQPIREIGNIARDKGICFHTDAAQSAGKIPVDVNDLGVDMLTVAGHKFYAPKGVGALHVRRGTKLEPLIHGGGQERGFRAGTENVALIAGLGKAAKLAGEELDSNLQRLTALRNKLLSALESKPGRVKLNGHPTERLPNTLNISFEEIDSSMLLASLPELAASTGSACHADRKEPSDVLTAMGVPRELALGAVRLSIGRYTTENDISRASEVIAVRVTEMRSKR